MFGVPVSALPLSLRSSFVRAICAALPAARQCMCGLVLLRVFGIRPSPCTCSKRVVLAIVFVGNTDAPKDERL